MDPTVRLLPAEEGTVVLLSRSWCGRYSKTPQFKAVDSGILASFSATTVAHRIHYYLIDSILYKPGSPGTDLAFNRVMTVVMPIWQNRISPVLDFAVRFLVVEFNGSQETGRREVLIGESHWVALARGICELGAQTLVCGAISQPLEMKLEKSGVQIISHVCGEVNGVLKAWIGGALDRPEYALPGCWGKRRGSVCCCWRNEQQQIAASETNHQNVKIAIPLVNGLLSEHFGHCEQFALVEVNLETKTIVSQNQATPPPHEPGVLPRWLHEQGVLAIVAGGMGQRALNLFGEYGISVQTGTPGQTPELLAQAYLRGELTAGVAACGQHGSHHGTHHGCHH